MCFSTCVLLLFLVYFKFVVNVFVEIYEDDSFCRYHIFCKWFIDTIKYNTLPALQTICQHIVLLIMWETIFYRYEQTLTNNFYLYIDEIKDCESYIILDHWLDVDKISFGDSIPFHWIILLFWSFNLNLNKIENFG